MALKTLFGGTYAGRKVLVTGHTGFKGSWLCLWLNELGAHVTGLALPPDTHPAHWSLLNLSTVHDLHADLRNPSMVRHALDQVQPEIVFHLASQSLVRRGYREPSLTFETNVLGLVNLLEAIRATSSVRALINVTSDKVYQEQAIDGGYSENHPLGGYDPYSTSKACAELVTECYRKNFFDESGPKTATARAGNVIGGGDWSEDRLVPDFVRAASSGHILQIRKPEAIRPWQHVLEPLSGYLQLGQILLNGGAAEGAWNFGPSSDASISVQELIMQLQAQWPTQCRLHKHGEQSHEAATLRLNSTKAMQKLKWRPVWDMSETLPHTVLWYRMFYETGELRSHADLNDYTTAARAAGLEWAM